MDPNSTRQVPKEDIHSAQPHNREYNLSRNDGTRRFYITDPDLADKSKELVAESIDFGVLLAPGNMLIKRTRQSNPRGQVRMVLNLGRREIDIRFPSVYSDKTQEFKFIIPIDQVFDLSQYQAAGDTKTSFILTLRTAPRFYRKLSGGITSTHDDAAFSWREQDAWLRQTNVLRQPQELEQLKSRPISLKNHPEGIVNIGRWTTYRITVDDNSIDREKYRVFRAALRDYNVPISKAGSFDFVRDHGPAWDLLEASLPEYESAAHLPTTPHLIKHSLQDLLGSKKNDMYLPFSVRYQLEVCITNGWINEHNLTRCFLETLSSTDHNRAKHILESVALERIRIFEPMDAFKLRVQKLPSMKSRIPENCVLVRSAVITPSTMILSTPYVEMTNRVIRKYREHADRFLRVRFEDDEFRGYARINATSQKTMAEVLSKVFRTLNGGIMIGDRHYEFLAFGNSQLREHGAYFFASLPSGPTASHIRAWMGRFEHERIVAKHAARIGQCFSTTRAIKNAGFPPVRKADLVDDVERNGFNFTDGVGKISPFYAQTIAKELRLRGPPPSVFQFRMAGCKGVLAIAPELGATNLKLRRSQFKFETSYSGMEIIRWSEYWVATLNRQLILVLSALGVPDEVFLHLQEKEIQLMERAMIDDKAALEALTGHVDANGMTLSMAGLVQAGLRRSNEPFVTSLLRLWRAWSIKYLKEKARLPICDGAFVLGCTDETRTLRGHFAADQMNDSADTEAKTARLPEIFIQITCPQSGQRKVIEGLCVIARNPSLHPGDLRVVKAVDVPALRHLADVLVLPQTGDRDIASMCSGGDLDGDDYVVIWDDRLIPPIWNAEPMDYTAPTPVKLKRDVTQTDITKFFVQYMKNDFLPKIAHAHIAWADFLDDGIRHDKCLELALLHSKAVDYPKTGQPAQMPKALNAKKWPHFMEKKGGGVYHSEKILGQLYDAVDRVAFTPNHEAPFDDRILNACDPGDEIMQAARELKNEYDISLQRIMAQHDIKTEFEVWSTFVLDHSKASKDYKFHEEIGQLSQSLKEQYRVSVHEKAGGREWSCLVPWAVAMYRVTKEELEAAKAQGNGAAMPFISFPWILQNTLTQIIKGVNNVEGQRQKEHGKHLLGSVVGPVLNTETQMYDDPYQPGVVEAGEQMQDNVADAERLVPEGQSASDKVTATEPRSLLDIPASITHSDAHHTSNDGFPSAPYAPSIGFPPQPTAEQFSRIEQIIQPSHSSGTVGKTQFTSPVIQLPNGSAPATQARAKYHPERSLLDSSPSPPRSGFGLPRNSGRSTETSSDMFERIWTPPSAVMPDPFSQPGSGILARDLIHSRMGSEHTASTIKNHLYDAPKRTLDDKENRGRHLEQSMPVSLFEDLADIRTEAPAPLEPARNSRGGYAVQRPDRPTLAASGTKRGVEDLLTPSRDPLEEATSGLGFGNGFTVAEKATNGMMTRSGADGGVKTAGMNDLNLMDDLEDTENGGGGDEDEDDDDDDDGGMIFVDPLTMNGDGRNDVDRLIRLGGL